MTEAGDNVGYCLFDEKVLKKAVPELGFKQFHNLCFELIDARNYGGGKNLTSALRYALSTLSENSVVIIISDFIGLEKDWHKYLKVAGYKFDLIGIMVRDPIDEEMPADGGQLVAESPFSEHQLVVVPDEVKKRYAYESAKVEKEIHETFRKCNADTMRLKTTEPYVHKIRTYFEKRRQEFI